MNIKIFEDQTGFALFPEKSFNKDADIVRLFDNKIDLYVRKEDNNLEISCYVLISKGQERAIGCYIIGNNKHIDGIFTDFKKNANEALKSIGFSPQSDNVENAIFDGLEKFDSTISSKINIDEISKALDANEKLSYNAGDVTEIAVFSRQLLKNIEKIKITISTGQTNLGDINVLRNKTYQERLSPTNDTKDIFDRRRNSIRRKKEDEENKKRDEEKRKKGDSGDNNINEGKKLIIDGLSTKRGAGYDTEEDIKRVYTEISGKPLPEKSGGIGTGAAALMAISFLMLGLIVGGIVMQYYLTNNKEQHVPVPTPVPTSEIITISTTENIPVQNENVDNTTSNSSMDNNTDIANKTNETMNKMTNDTMNKMTNDTVNKMTNETSGISPTST